MASVDERRHAMISDPVIITALIVAGVVVIALFSGGGHDGFGR